MNWASERFIARPFRGLQRDYRLPSGGCDGQHYPCVLPALVTEEAVIKPRPGGVAADHRIGAIETPPPIGGRPRGVTLAALPDLGPRQSVGVIEDRSEYLGT